jgi:hypothetical protein
VCTAVYGLGLTTKNLLYRERKNTVWKSGTEKERNKRDTERKEERNDMLLK